MHRRDFLLITALALAASLTTAGPALAVAPRLKVVTSTTDLYDIASSVGGDRVTVTHISEGYQDPHFVEAKPSFVLQLRNADVFAFVGLDLEIGWMPLLLQGARNPKIQMGGAGYVDVSRVIPVLDVPQGNVDRSQGDVHPLGNPHYWLDPDNARRIAQLFRDKFSQLDPAGAATYARNAASFDAKLAAAERGWAPYLAQIKGKPVVAWHTSWRYFAEYTGMNIVGFMEPKPGVPPSPQHLAGLVQTMKRTGAKVIIMEPFYDRRTADRVAGLTGAKVLMLPPSVGGIKGLDDYLAVMDYDIKQLAAAVR
ncbi:MAG TPA: metal ABC transporter substrate-binding protein [Gemmatimonadaceae bacterium]|nr:metal ABC transporter substrate-binding protein [Gemmatimonadaceae bacterium]